MVSAAAACNFFQAIDNRRLEVSVEDLRPGQESEPRVLNDETLESVLKKHSDEKRAKAFLSGQKAYECFRTLREGQTHLIDTSAERYSSICGWRRPAHRRALIYAETECGSPITKIYRALDIR